MADEEYLLNKTFINTNVYSVEKNIPSYLKEQEEFRQFMEDKDLDYDDINEDEEYDLDLIRQEIPFNIKFSKEEKSEKKQKNKQNNNHNSLGMTISKPIIPTNEFKRFIVERRNLIYIDSRDRDKLIYTEPNYYKIPLKKAYANVVAIKLKSTEFTNTQQLIRSTPASLKNNVISWKILADGDATTYSIALTPGNYSATTLQSLLETSMNSIRRVNGKYNSIGVSVDIVTDIVKFSSIDYTTISNPFSFGLGVNNQTVVTVDYDTNLHGLLSGSTVYIEDASSIGGIDTGIWNATHIINEIIDVNKYTIIVNAAAVSSENNVGGNTVKIGIGLDFKILFSEAASPYELLGFPNVDTEYSVITTNSVESFYYVEEVLLDSETEPILESAQIVPITSSGQNDYVIYPKVTNINGYVRVSIKKIFAPTIAEESSIFSYVRTNYNHNLETGDEVFIFQESNTVYEKLTIFDHKYGYTVDNVTYFALNAAEESSISSFVQEVSNPAGLLVTYVDNNTFKIPVPYISVSKIETWITNVIDIETDATIEYGSIVTTMVNQSLNLSGEKYIFMQSDTLGNGETSGKVSNIFAKIQLASSSGADIYNGYIGGYQVYIDTPLNSLTELDFRFYKNDGELFEFYDNDHSFTLEITEAVQKIDGTGFSSRIGTHT